MADEVLTNALGGISMLLIIQGYLIYLCVKTHRGGTADGEVGGRQHIGHRGRIEVLTAMVPTTGDRRQAAGVTPVCRLSFF
jgi:hypothetical protein